MKLSNDDFILGLLACAESFMSRYNSAVEEMAKEYLAAYRPKIKDPITEAKVRRRKLAISCCPEEEMISTYITKAGFRDSDMVILNAKTGEITINKLNQ